MNKKANMVLTENDLQKFKDEWAKFDPKGTGFISYGELKMFLKKIGFPLGFDAITAVSPERQKDYIANLDLCTYNRCKHYNFYDILRKLAKHLLLKIKLESEKNLDIKTGKKIFNKLRSELDFENTEKLEQIEAIKSLFRNEIKVDKNLEKSSDKFTPLHFKAAFIIVGYYRRYKRHNKVQRADSLRHMLEDKIQELEEPDDGFRKNKLGNRFVKVVLNTSKLQLKHSNIYQLLRGSLTIIDEDFATNRKESSKFDESSSYVEMNSKNKSSSNQKLSPDIAMLAKSKTKRISNTGSDMMENSSKLKIIKEKKKYSNLNASKMIGSELTNHLQYPSSLLVHGEDNNRSFVSNSINLDSAVTPTENKESPKSTFEEHLGNFNFSKYTTNDKMERKLHKKLTSHKPNHVLQVDMNLGTTRKVSNLEELKNEFLSLRYDRSDHSSEEEEEDDDKIKPFDEDDELNDSRLMGALPSIQTQSFNTKERRQDHFDPKELDSSQFGTSKDNQDINDLEEELKDTMQNKSIGQLVDVSGIEAINSKRSATTGIPIRNFAKVHLMQNNVFKPSTPRRDVLDTARTARKMMNQDTQREIMGNVWINDLHHKEKIEQNNDIIPMKHGSLGLQAKNSTNYEDELNLDDYDKILNQNDSPYTKFTKPHYIKGQSDIESLFSMNDKTLDNNTFSSLELSQKKLGKHKKIFNIDISGDFTDLEANQ